MAGNVSVRFSVQDAEVVRKALKDIGDDGKAALDKLDAAGKRPGNALTLLSAAVETVKSRLMGLAVPLGPVGSALIGMGPAGLIAAAGLGGLITALGKVSDLANEMAAKSQKLSKSSELFGLTTDEIQALSDVTQKAGKSQDDTTSAVERATVAWDQLRNGQGAAFDQIRKIDPELLNQLASAKGTAEALDILAQAYSRATDAAQRNAIVRAFFGKGGVSTGNAILAGISDSGGIKQLTDEAKAAGVVIDKELIEKLTKLKVQIDDLKDRNKNVFGKMFSGDALEAEKKWQEDLSWILSKMEAIADAATRIGNSGFFKKLTEFTGRLGLNSDPASMGLTLTNQNAGGADGEGPRPRVNIYGTPAVPPPAATTEVPVEVRLRQQRDLVAALGPAVTVTEQLKLRTLELEDAQKNNGLSTANAARAMDASRNAIAQTIAATKERLGVATEEQIVEARMAQLRAEQARGIITDSNDIARAQQLIQKEAKAAAEALQIRASNYPGLKQLELDANNLNKTLDQGATELSNNFGAELANISTGAESTAQGFSNMGKSIISTISQILYKMTVAKGLAVGFQALFSAFLPGVGGGVNVGSATSFSASAKGNVFSGPGISAFSSSVVSRPTIFPFAKGIGLMGEAGDEGILPLTRINGKLGVHATGGGGPSVQMNFINAPPVESKSSSTDSGGNQRVDIVFKKMIEQVGVESIANGEMGRAIVGKFGSKQFQGT